MTQAEQNMASDRVGLLGRLALLALALNGFAIVTVNYWIYTARWSFIERNSAYYFKPPTISRAISDPFIGEPFAIWVTISGICLTIGVGILALHYLRLFSHLKQPTPALRFMAMVFPPLIFVLQASSGVGMHMLSSYRFPDANEMHMVGSYIFFLSQALVIVTFTIANRILLRNPVDLAFLEDTGEISRKWVRIRYWAGMGSIALVVLYFGLFVAKDIYAYDDAKLLYLFYVSVEPVAISSFLLVLALCHVDLHSRYFARRRA